ncbi:MAG: hypothetical protein ABI216_06795 [Devosia sp.]
MSYWRAGVGARLLYAVARCTWITGAVRRSLITDIENKNAQAPNEANGWTRDRDCRR